jgi:hypothetical protein
VVTVPVGHEHLSRTGDCDSCGLTEARGAVSRAERLPQGQGRARISGPELQRNGTGDLQSGLSRIRVGAQDYLTCLFNDAAVGSDYVASNDRMISE